MGGGGDDDCARGGGKLRRQAPNTATPPAVLLSYGDRTALANTEEPRARCRLHRLHLFESSRARRRKSSDRGGLVFTLFVSERASKNGGNTSNTYGQPQRGLPKDRVHRERPLFSVESSSLCGKRQTIFYRSQNYACIKMHMTP